MLKLQLKKEVEGIEDIDKREDLYTEIDNLEKELILYLKNFKWIFSGSFHSSKTARRFKDNSEIC
jgi:preprotein translocase subunit SecA